MHYFLKHIVFIFTVLVIGLVFSTANAQISININARSDRNLTIEQLKRQKEKVTSREKAALKEEIDSINKELENGKITEEVAEQKKHAAAEKHALNIKNQLDIIDANIELIKRNDSKNSDYYRDMGYLDPQVSLKDKIKSKIEAPSRTQLGLMLAFGINNAIGPSQSLDNSPYRIGNSGFFSFSLNLETMLSKSGYVRFNYGLGFQFNNLQPSDNLFFNKYDKMTLLETFDHDLKKSRFNINNIVIPLHLELGKVDKFYHSSGFKLGLGGYLGLNMSAIQTLKFKEDGHKIKQRIINNYNTNNLIYGLSAYFGWKWISLYAKYDLNTIFSHNPTEEHNASIGLQLEF